mgnify:FL=1
MLACLVSPFKPAAVFLFSPRDRDLLQLLDRTPATPSLIVKASATFAGEPFRDERRARERLQQLSHERLIRAWSIGQPGGGITKYYKLTPSGFSALHGEEVALPPRAFFSDIPLSRLEHSLLLADVIIHTLVAAKLHRVQVPKFHRENELTLSVGQFVQQPDCHFQFVVSGKTFNVLFEVDRSTESVNSSAEQSVRQKILGYEAYQDMVIEQWKESGRQWMRPLFRVAFLTLSVERAYHILRLAGSLSRNPTRLLCYATTYDEFLGSSDAVREPLFLDHAGAWQSLVNLHPSSRFLREPVRLPKEPSSQLF